MHFEIDIPDPSRAIPVGTTGEVHIDIGTPEPASEIPLYAATIRGNKASLFVVDQGVARQQTVSVKGEAGGSLFLDTGLAAGAAVVTEGRAILEDGDRVQALEMADPETATAIRATPEKPLPNDLGKASAVQGAP